MSVTQKMRLDTKLDSEEKEIEDNLDIRKRLSSKKKAQELAKFKAAAPAYYINFQRVV